MWGASPPPHSRRRRRRQCPVGAASARARGGILPPQPGCVLPSGRLHGSSSSMSRNASRQLGAAPRSRAPRSHRRSGAGRGGEAGGPRRRCAACPGPCRSRAGVPAARKSPPLAMRAATVNSPGSPPAAGPPPSLAPRLTAATPTRAPRPCRRRPSLVALAALPFTALMSSSMLVPTFAGSGPSERSVESTSAVVGSRRMLRSTPPPLSGWTALFAFAAAPHLSIICCYGPAGGRERTEPEAGRQALGRPASLLYADQRIRAPASSLLSPLVDYRLAAYRWYPPCFHVRARGAQRHPLGSSQLNTNGHAVRVGRYIGRESGEPRLVGTRA